MRVLAMIFLLLAGCASVPANHFDTALASTVHIETPEGSGTGVVLNDRCVLTVEHVADTGLISVTTHGGQAVTMHVVASDAQKDIAVACGEPIGVPAVHLGHEPALYSHLFTIGFPLGFHEFLTEGRYEGSAAMSVISAPGNSGGGVWDESGAVVGLVDAIAAYPINGNPALFTHLAMMVTIADIREFLSAHHINYQG